MVPGHQGTYPNRDLIGAVVSLSSLPKNQQSVKAKKILHYASNEVAAALLIRSHYITNSQPFSKRRELEKLQYKALPELAAYG